MANISFQELLTLVDRLSPSEQTELTAHLLEAAQKRLLSTEEKMRLLRSVQVDVNVLEPLPRHRAAWYDDDGR